MSKPKYMEIIEYIKEKIAKGEWVIGSRIPSQRTLAATFNVNRSTVITALEELMADGLIKGVAGKGTIVTNNTWTLMGNNPTANWNENVSLGTHKASVATVQAINEAEANEAFIQLSKGELAKDLFPGDKMKSVVKRVAEQEIALGYEKPKGNIRLRYAISQYLNKRGMDVSPEAILIVSGALQALHLISIGLLKKGSTVFLEKPSYLYSLSVFQSAGMQLKGLSMDQEGPTLHPLYQAKHTDNSIVYTNPTFQNPTGKLMSDRRREELLDVCKEHQLPIIEDDVYRDLWLDGPPPASLKSKDLNGNVLYLGSLSKTLSPGLRIGWIAGTESVISRLADLKMQSDYGSSTLSQLVAAEWLTSGLYEAHIKTVREQLRIRRTAALDALDSYVSDYATWEIPRGGLFIWLKVKPGFKTPKLFEKALSKGIVLNPGSIYAETSGQFIRISYGCASMEEIRKGIYELGKLLKDIK